MLFECEIIPQLKLDKYEVPQLNSNNFYSASARVIDLNYKGADNLPVKELLKLIPELYNMLYKHRVKPLYIADVPQLNINKYKIIFPRGNNQKKDNSLKIKTLSGPNYKSVFINANFNILICADPQLFYFAATISINLNFGGSAILAWNDTAAAKHFLCALTNHFRCVQKVKKSGATFVLLHYRKSGDIFEFRDYLMQVEKNPNTVWFKNINNLI